MNNSEQLKQELAKSFKENYTSFTFYYSNRLKIEEINIHPKDWKMLRKTFIRKLKSKKDSCIRFKGFWFERDKEYKYPDKESMYKYFRCEDFATGKYKIHIWSQKYRKSDIYIYEEDFKK